MELLLSDFAESRHLSVMAFSCCGPITSRGIRKIELVSIIIWMWQLNITAADRLVLNLVKPFSPFYFVSMKYILSPILVTFPHLSVSIRHTLLPLQIASVMIHSSSIFCRSNHCLSSYYLPPVTFLSSVLKSSLGGLLAVYFCLS